MSTVWNMKSSQPNTLSKGVCIQKNVRETLAMDSILGKQEISKSNRKEKKKWEKKGSFSIKWSAIGQGTNQVKRIRNELEAACPRTSQGMLPRAG